MIRLRRALRVGLFYCAMLGFLAAFAAFAYFTRHPESPWLERAQDWPAVGMLAYQFRQAYLGPPEVAEVPQDAPEKDTLIAYREDDTGPSEPLTVFLPEGQRDRVERVNAGAKPRSSDSQAQPKSSKPAASQLASTETATRVRPKPTRTTRRRPPESQFTYIVDEWRWFRPGHDLYEEPKAGTPRTTRLEALSRLPILDRKGSWVQVVHHGDRVWLDTSWEPPFKRRWATRGLLRHRVEPVESSDWGRYREARKLLGIDGKPDKKLGAYTLLTDVDDPDLLAFLHEAAAAAEDAYFARYGRLPSGDPGRSVVLFAKEVTYRQYSSSSHVATDRHVGHAGRGIATFFAEGRPRAELTRTLVHEIGHLLNDRSLAQRLPPWLEEGIATDLGSAWLEDDPLVTGDTGRIENWGPDARLRLLGDIQESGNLPTAETLMYADHEAFFRNARVQKYAYAHSFALVRYLLDPDEGHAEGFREFLKKIADGWGADPDLLAKRLDVDLEGLDQGFRSWLEQEAQAARERIADRMRAR